MNDRSQRIYGSFGRLLAARLSSAGCPQKMDPPQVTDRPQMKDRPQAMGRRYRGIRWIGLVLVGLSWLGSESFLAPTLGDEPAEAFLQALRDAGHYDLAIDYLEQVQQGNLISDEFRQKIPFEKAATIIQSTALLRDIELWEERLNEAQTLLEQVAKQANTTDSKIKSIEELANLRFRQSRIYVHRSTSDRLTTTEQTAALERARQLMQESLQSFDQARELLRPELESVTKVAEGSGDDAEAARKRLEPLRNTFTQIRLRNPIVREALADTYPAQDATRTQLLTQALKDYSEIWDKYYRYAAGVDACLFAARCQTKLGKNAEALALLEEIFEMSDSPKFRELKRTAAELAVQCWKSIEPYPHDMVIAKLEPLVTSLDRNEQRSASWLQLQLELAIAYRAQATHLETAKTASPGDVARINRTAGVILRSLARSSGEVRDRARQLLSEWKMAGAGGGGDEEQGTVESFADAKQRAIDLVAEVEGTLRDLNALRSGREPAENNDSAADEKILSDDLNAAVDRALAMLRTALSKADATTSPVDLNHIRYLQAFSYFAKERYFETALIGEFLMTKYAGVDWTRQAAGLVVNAYTRIYDSAADQDKAFEKQRLVQVCQQVVELWPGSSESDTAANVRARLALADNDFAVAQQFLERISTNANSRSAVGLQVSQRLWFDYRREKSQLSDEQIVARAEELNGRLQQVREMIKDSLASVSQDEITYDAALSSLLLVSANLEANDLPAAVDQLEKARLAPLDLIKQQHPAIFESNRSGQFLREAYRTAIAVYLANLRTGVDTASWLDKASAVLDALKTELAKNGNEQELIQIYSALAKELRGQFQLITSPQEKENLAKSIGQFLAALEKQTRDGRTLLWVGNTLREIADSLVLAAPQSNHARALFDQAYTVLAKAESIGFGGDDQAEALWIDTKRNQALALRGQQKFEEAVKVFVEALEKRPQDPRLQIEAARTLQLWGASAGRANIYAQAISGSEPQVDPQNPRRKRNVIWGWRQLVTITQGKDQFTELHHESLYHLLESWLEFGILEKRDKAIESAFTELGKFRQRDASLGGADWKPRFEALEKRIQAQRGKSPQ